MVRRKQWHDLEDQLLSSAMRLKGAGLAFRPGLHETNSVAIAFRNVKLMSAAGYTFAGCAETCRSTESFQSSPTCDSLHYRFIQVLQGHLLDREFLVDFFHVTLLLDRHKLPIKVMLYSGVSGVKAGLRVLVSALCGAYISC
jgi:hypothetical protein